MQSAFFSPPNGIVVFFLWTLGLAGCTGSDETPFTPDPDAYPGSVLLVTGDHPGVMKPGDVVDVGREPWVLPPVVLHYAEGGITRADGPVGQAMCVAPDASMDLVLRPGEALPEPLEYVHKSVAFWVRPPGLKQAPVTLYSARYSDTAGMAITASVSETRLDAWDTEQDWSVSQSGRALPPGEWTHVAFSLDARHPDTARRGLTFYINADSGTATQARILHDHGPHLSFHGVSAGDGEPVCYDEIALYIDPLTAFSIRDIYAYGLGVSAEDDDFGAEPHMDHSSREGLGRHSRSLREQTHD